MCVCVGRGFVILSMHVLRLVCKCVFTRVPPLLVIRHQNKVAVVASAGNRHVASYCHIYILYMYTLIMALSTIVLMCLSQEFTL